MISVQITEIQFIARLCPKTHKTTIHPLLHPNIKQTNTKRNFTLQFYNLQSF